MKTRLMIGVALGLVILGILVLGYLFLSMTPRGDTTPNTPSGGNPFGFSVDGEPTKPTSNRIIVTKEGNLTVADFTEGKEAISLSEDPSDLQYDLTPYPPYEPGKPYSEHSYDIQFNERGSQFIVTLNKEPLKASRLEAEMFLRNVLEVSDTTLCTVDVVVGVPYGVNQTLSVYQNLGLSFCPDAFPLP